MKTGRILCGGESEGIEMSYDGRTRTITVFGWFDTCVGIKGFHMPIAAFLDALNISESDIIRSRADAMKGKQLCTQAE